MTLPADRLATGLADRYFLERELGAGGMATVYLARDLRHDRLVAIKLLRPELGAVIGAERFLSEIRTTANLQHPHILPLHDSGECEGLLYYVMPFVEGESLRDRLAREKQLPIAEAIRIAAEVAGALDYAHRRGVIHRDIKPENILLHDGRALIADFGIALAASKAGGARMTETGMSLGTPHYMSPEQAMGEREITPRSDVYALGCVLYEMLVGDPPFTGSTAQAVVAKVVTAQPEPLRAHRQTIPPHVEAAVLAALQKLPADRFASAAEFAHALEKPGAVAATVPMAAVARPAQRPAWRLVALTCAAVALVSLALAAWAWRRGGSPREPVRRYVLALRKVRWDGDPFRTQLAVSADGSRLVYAGAGDDGPSLWLRYRDRLDPVPLPGTTGGVHPAFSPDGNQLAFTVGGSPVRLLRMSVSGAPPTVLTDSVVGLDGLAWGDDGFLYYDGLTQGGTRGIMRVREDGTLHEQVTTVDTARGEVDHIRPALLPGGRGLVFSIVRREQGSPVDLAVLDLRTREVRTLVRGTMARWLPPRHLLYVTAGGALLALPFDLDRLQAAGEPVSVASGTTAPDGASVHLATDARGTAMYLTPEGASRARQVVRVDAAGNATAYDPGWSGDFRSLAVSPDGDRVAVSVFSAGEQHIWVKQLPRGPFSRLTFETSPNLRPTWTPDGRAVTYHGIRRGLGIILQRRADGTGASVTLAEELPLSLVEVSHSPDGAWLLVRSNMGDVYGRRAGDSALVPLLASAAAEAQAVVSPDGRWLAHASNESGRSEVYVRPFPSVDDARWLVSTRGAFQPRWARDGRTLYMAGPDSILAVSVNAGPTPTFGAPRGLFATAPYVMNAGSWDVTPDGKGFVMIRRGNAGDEPELVVIERLDRALARGATAP